MLNKDEFIRYSRQIMYSDFEEKGQIKLKKSHVVVAGIGGLGTTASIYLAAAGIGHITLVDSDRVQLSNLNRQILFYEEDIGDKKPFIAAQKLAKFNSGVEITALSKKITKENVKDIIRDANVVIDALDNLDTRFILNKACVDQKIPFIHGGIYGLLGEITTIIPGETPCLSCIFPNIRRKKSTFPVFGVTPALVAVLQVSETIKLLAGFGQLLKGKMLYINASKMDFTTANLARNPDCNVCGK